MLYHFGGGVDYIHFLKNGGSVIGDKNFALAVFDHFVHAPGT